MIRITLICVGKLKERYFEAACAEYQKRLKPLCRLEIIELAEQPESPRALEREAVKILSHIPENAHVTALCVEGESKSSEALAAFIERLTLSGASHLCFIIGSSHGLDASVKSRAAARLSMSAMTFPHHLARVMLLEQIYRASMILTNSAYHK